MSTSPPLPHSESRTVVLPWLGGSLAVALLVRLIFWLNYNPVPYSDTPSYRRLAQSVLDDFARYDGTRTPGYPAFLALIGADQTVWAVQMGMGVLTTLALFYLGWRLSGKGWFGALVAFAHTFNLGQLFFEANLLTETLTTFYLVIVFVGYFLLLRQDSQPQWGIAFGVGLAASLALLTRPLFVFLPVWAGLFIAWGLSPFSAPSSQTGYEKRRGNIFQTFKAYFLTTSRSIRLVAFGLPVMLLVGGWVMFIHQRFGDWGLTTMTGYHLVQHTGGYFEYVPDEYATIRDTYIQFRDAKIETTGTQTNAIWDAIPELSRVSGLNFYDLSRTLARISIRLILEHPDLYFKNIFQGWWMFWRAPVYWTPEALHNQNPTEAIKGFILFQRGILVAVNFLFVASSLIWAAVCYLPQRLLERLPKAFRRLRKAFVSEIPNNPDNRVSQRFMLFLSSIIWITSIVQSLLDHGDNPRFLLPLQSFVVLWVAWFTYRIIRKPEKFH